MIVTMRDVIVAAQLRMNRLFPMLVWIPSWESAWLKLFLTLMKIACAAAEALSKNNVARLDVTAVITGELRQLKMIVNELKTNART